ncbi:Clan CD, family C13, asparaginyl endopeptidase-like cysteine peptidase [Trichomonas vaginalis G3]|uniref:Clan CD, family C13, asparaginyl endopeptidase-like cysteine peptidase n=1 Tax=Trichomonas vaginalis (strain ATCC PRA-98 / G3) TaxID=412133 RepID=A2DYT2_TRIV3|nr:Clan CD, family C13, legumain-like cysteine peptidase [Trichomonas vaginalis G3]EAY14472.1 Clan CD, family C13, asparaginyl endopeptidase-like cysteine peptidase [Trichomonas vaginalis G3]KAI5519652.1 Clan CD, family C13, legumain-like cysteine peptidase [Trichomonas vaginalis G3]|eukprot:XP_001326695.1 Clan CD, family C13, asparaginyl endopeptidase-like cysteine peptidase [Trichomonas vaginalis G3]
MFCLLQLARCDRFAVLIAGSNDFYNYRHQADIFNMYQQLVKRGFDDQHITMMAYDDIALSSENPFRGKVFHTLKHVNIYPGSSKINYAHNSVTADQFYTVLTTLKSTTSDNVYIYYDNHGGPGILGVPDGVPGGYIEAEPLAKAFDTMEAKGLYGKLFFGIEACYSGSVAAVFRAKNMCTITAANDDESSYAAVYDSTVGAYLSNEFSNYFMAYLDSNPQNTIGNLYTKVKAQTTGSHVCYYGDVNMKNLKLSDFLGTPNEVVAPKADAKIDIIPHYLATKSTLYQLAQSTDAKIAGRAKVALHEVIAAAEKLDLTLTSIAEILEPETKNVLRAKCGKITPEYFEVLHYFTEKYGVVKGDDMIKLRVLVNLALKHKVADIKAAIDAIC